MQNNPIQSLHTFWSLQMPPRKIHEHPKDGMRHSKSYKAPQFFLLTNPEKSSTVLISSGVCWMGGGRVTDKTTKGVILFPENKAGKWIRDSHPQRMLPVYLKGVNRKAPMGTKITLWWLAFLKLFRWYHQTKELPSSGRVRLKAHVNAEVRPATRGRRACFSCRQWAPPGPSHQPVGSDLTPSIGGGLQHHYQYHHIHILTAFPGQGLGVQGGLTDYSLDIHNMSNLEIPVGLTACLWTVGGERKAQRKPTQHREDMQTPPT